MARFRRISSFAALLLLTSCASPPPIVEAPPVSPPAVPAELAQSVSATTIVTLKDSVSEDRVASIAGSFAAAGKGKVIAVYTSVGKGFAVTVPLAKAQKIAPRFSSVETVEADSLVYAYEAAGCGSVGGAPMPAGETVPWGIARVGGPLVGDFTGKTAWIIDSGLDNSSGEISVDPRGATCLASRRACQAANDTNTADGLGHGTMIAGIIAARANGSGLVGIAPGATVASVKIFDHACAASGATVRKALDWVGQNAQPGEVVAIGWGTQPWKWNAGLDAMVRALADKGLKVAVAAGNEASWVMNVSPARAGGYQAPNGSGGLVMTASAIDPNNHFWRSSNWGSAPPDFAEPGVNIESLGLAGKVDTLSGTSFAAAHLAGILLGGQPRIDGRASGDPGDGGDPGKDDPIGACCAR